MSQADMKKRPLDPSSDEDIEEKEDFDQYYLDFTDDLDYDEPKKRDDPEYFEYKILQPEDAERFLSKEAEGLSSSLKVSPSVAKLLLHTGRWQCDEIIEKYQQDHEKLLVESNISCAEDKKEQDTMVGSSLACPVCAGILPKDQYMALTCGHQFCLDCWEIHLRFQIEQGHTMDIECMGQECKVLVPEDFLLAMLTEPNLRDRFTRLCLMDSIKDHPKLRFCPGPNCAAIIHAKEPSAKKVECSVCESVYCFQCGSEYHAPTDCDVMKKWLKKCAIEDTASSIRESSKVFIMPANVKKCPSCDVYIQKDAGCSHMQCTWCHHHFCWVCLGSWNSHKRDFYRCSRYREPEPEPELKPVQASEDVKKHLFYFERWQNHGSSLELEEKTLKKITEFINRKVRENEGTTWIDWQYLQNAAALLKKCRYTLQYTYPYAFYMEQGARKQLFEYQQAQLEVEVENLSWQVDHAESTHRGDLENQMNIAEKKRQTLLKDFLV